jgi:cytochrome c553
MTQEPKKRGRPVGSVKGVGAPIMVRLDADRLAALDGWIAGQDEPKPTRPEAVRRLVDTALKRRT